MRSAPSPSRSRSKSAPYYSAFANGAARLREAGAGGFVLFDRFLQPGIDLETVQIAPSLALSTPAELRLPLRWIAILRGRVAVDPAGTTGVHDWQGVLRA